MNRVTRVFAALSFLTLSSCGSDSDPASSNGPNNGSGDSDGGAQITVVSWGGAYTNSQVEVYHKPWTALTGNTINSVDYNGAISDIRNQVDSGNVTWDVVDVEIDVAIDACDEGLLEPIDPATLPPAPDGTPATLDFIAGTIQPCAVPSIIWSTVIGYNETQLTVPPTSIADFFDVDTFPGKRGVRNHPKGIVEMALMADGVAPASVYSLLSTQAGIDRAFSKLDQIKDNTVFWNSSVESIEFLSNPEVAMTTTYNGRLFKEAEEDNNPYGTLWDGQIWDMDLWVIPRGTPNKELAMDFIKFSTATEQLAAQASYIAYGPARMSSLPLIGTHFQTGTDMRLQVPNGTQNFQNALQNDEQFWNANEDSIVERFIQWRN